jgi:hypothetical protein
MGYESFLMDLGMYGDLLGYDYQRFSGLVTDNTWFKTIWWLMHNFNVYASFDANNQLHWICEGDCSLMELFFTPLLWIQHCFFECFLIA